MPHWDDTLVVPTVYEGRVIAASLVEELRATGDLVIPTSVIVTRTPRGDLLTCVWCWSSLDWWLEEAPSSFGHWQRVRHLML